MRISTVLWHIKEDVMGTWIYYIIGGQPLETCQSVWRPDLKNSMGSTVTATDSAEDRYVSYCYCHG